MKIGFIYPHSIIDSPQPQLFDALAIVCYELTRRIAQQHDVVFYPRLGHGQQTEDLLENVQIKRIPVTKDRLVSLLRIFDTLPFIPKDHPFRVTDFYYHFYAKQVASDLARRETDIAHINGIPNFIPTIRKANPKIKIVLHMHDHALADFDYQTTLSRLADADLILGCSNFIRDEICDRFPEIADRCKTLHNGIDNRFFSIERRPSLIPTIVFVGRLSPEKGVHVLLKAFALLKYRIPDIKLKIVGPNDMAPKQFVDPFRNDPDFYEVEAYYRRPKKAYLRHLKHLASLAGGVEFIGPVSNNKISEYLAEASVFVFPSIWDEPFGIPVIEAMAARVPVVASRKGAFPEVVEDGITGYLVNSNDPDQLSHVIESLVLDNQLNRRLGLAGRQRARNNFTWDSQAHHLTELYRDIC